MRRIILAAALALLPGLAFAQIITPGASGYQRLTAATTSSGNGADLTEDTLANCSTYTLPAGQLANLNDALHIVAGGTMGATTDVKTARVKLAGQTLQGITGQTAGGTQWQIDVWAIKRGASLQTLSAVGYVNNSSPAIGLSNATAITDTSAQPLIVTGQNATNSVAGSVTCGFLVVDFYRGS